MRSGLSACLFKYVLWDNDVERSKRWQLYVFGVNKNNSIEWNLNFKSHHMTSFFLKTLSLNWCIPRKYKQSTHQRQYLFSFLSRFTRKCYKFSMFALDDIFSKDTSHNTHLESFFFLPRHALFHKNMWNKMRVVGFQLSTLSCDEERTFRNEC